MKNPPIIALDFPKLEDALHFLESFGEEKLFVKVGMELYYQGGPSVIEEIKKRGHRIFLDLKLHDIPNTVKSAMKVLASLEVDMVNVHAAGGIRMMESALEGLEAGTSAGNTRAVCIAVTQLTSTSEEQMNKEQGISGKLEDSVLHYASLTKRSGLDGVVCSTLEAAAIHSALGDSFLTVTPGIRLLGGAAHDQKRVASPANARKLGADLIVVGRAVTAAADPIAAYKQVLQEWEGITC